MEKLNIELDAMADTCPCVKPDLTIDADRASKRRRSGRSSCRAFSETHVIGYQDFIWNSCVWNA